MYDLNYLYFPTTDRISLSTKYTHYRSPQTLKLVAKFQAVMAEKYQQA
jgi:hypothetical protein